MATNLSGRLLATWLLASVAAGCAPGGDGGPAGADPDRVAGLPDVLLVTLDTVRRNRLGAWGGRPDVSPRLDRLAAGGVVLAACDSASPLTLPSHGVILTGRYQPETGLRTNGRGRLRTGLPTLAQILRQAGYRTAAFVSTTVLDRRHGLDRGFQVYDDRLPPDRGERTAAATVDRALAWWRQPAAAPSLLWVHLFDPHAPYRPPEPWAGRFRDRPYEGEIAYADHHLGRLLDVAARRGALVSVIGDHGEGLDDHGEREHGLLLFQTTLAVPWVVAGAGLEPGRVSEPVRTVDLLPSLLGVLGLAAPPGLPGRDVLATAMPGPGTAPRGAGLAAGDPAADSYAETLMPWEDYGWQPLYALRRGRLKLQQGAYASLYDLAADPAEESDLLAAGDLPAGDPLRQAAAALAEELQRRRQDARSAPAGGAPSPAGAGSRLEPGAEPALPDADALAAPDPDRAERLRSLGYLAGGGMAGPAGPRPDPRDQTGFHDRVRAALAAYRDGSYDSAAALLDGILATQPENPFLQDLAGSVAMARSRAGEAVEWFTAALSHTPDRGPVEVHLAEALLASGRAPEAAERAASALAHMPDPAPPRAMLVRCRALSASGRPEESAAVAAAYLAEWERLAPATGEADAGAGGEAALAALRELARARTP